MNNIIVKPISETIKEHLSKFSEFIAFTTTLCSAVLMMLSKVEIIPSVFQQPNFIVLPIVSIIAFITWYIVPETIGRIRDRMQKIQNKNGVNNYELSEMSCLITSLKNTHDTLSQNNTLGRLRNHIDNVLVPSEPFTEMERMDEEVESAHTEIYIDQDGEKWTITKV